MAGLQLCFMAGLHWKDTPGHPVEMGGEYQLCGLLTFWLLLLTSRCLPRLHILPGTSLIYVSSLKANLSCVLWHRAMPNMFPCQSLSAS